MYHTNSNQNRVVVATVISDKIYFETSIISRHKEHAMANSPRYNN